LHLTGEKAVKRSQWISTMYVINRVSFRYKKRKGFSMGSTILAIGI